MTKYTATQTDNLNNSMEAARNFGDGLGTELEGLGSIASGSVTPTSGDREVITTGLSTVSHVVVSLSGSPTYDHFTSTATAGSVAGVVILQSWNGAYTSASVQFQRVDWIAKGT